MGKGIFVLKNASYKIKELYFCRIVNYVLFLERLMNWVHGKVTELYHWNLQTPWSMVAAPKIRCTKNDALTWKMNKKIHVIDMMYMHAFIYMYVCYWQWWKPVCWQLLDALVRHRVPPKFCMCHNWRYIRGGCSTWMLARVAPSETEKRVVCLSSKCTYQPYWHWWLLSK